MFCFHTYCNYFKFLNNYKRANLTTKMFYFHADFNYFNFLNNYKRANLNHYCKFDFWIIYLFFELFQYFCLN